MRALIAGSGRLPELLAQRLAEEGAQHRLCLVGDTVSPVLTGMGAVPFAFEELGSFLDALGSGGVTSVIFAGAVARPTIDPARADASTAALLPRLAAAMRLGDDGVLREIAAIFEERGLRVASPVELLPDLLPPAGVPTRAAPSPRDEEDARRAAFIHRALSAADTGQACAVAAGQALAIEALPGTAAMLAALGAQRAQIAALPPGGLLYKAPKPGQDRRMDLPAIGPDTIAQTAQAGLSGIVIEAGGVMVLDYPETLAAADAAGLFLWIRHPDRGGAP